MQYNCPKCGALLEEKEVLAAVEAPKAEVAPEAVVAVPEVVVPTPDVSVPVADIATPEATDAAVPTPESTA